MPNKLSHRKKSRKHNSRRTKKYNRKQKGGSGGTGSTGSTLKRSKGTYMSRTTGKGTLPRTKNSIEQQTGATAAPAQTTNAGVNFNAKPYDSLLPPNLQHNSSSSNSGVNPTSFNSRVNPANFYSIMDHNPGNTDLEFKPESVYGDASAVKAVNFAPENLYGNDATSLYGNVSNNSGNPDLEFNPGSVYGEASVVNAASSYIAPNNLYGNVSNSFPTSIPEPAPRKPPIPTPQKGIGLSTSDLYMHMQPTSAATNALSFSTETDLYETMANANLPPQIQRPHESNEAYAIRRAEESRTKPVNTNNSKKAKRHADLQAMLEQNSILDKYTGIRLIYNKKLAELTTKNKTLTLDEQYAILEDTINQYFYNKLRTDITRDDLSILERQVLILNPSETKQISQEIINKYDFLADQSNTK